MSDFRTVQPEDQASYIRNRLSLGTGHLALGLCIFAGGFSFGMEEAGFDVAGHLELTGLDLGTNVSRQRWPVHLSDLDGWLSLLKTVETPDAMYANPPCVAYAGTGKHLGTDDARMCYVRHCVYDAMMLVEPRVWTWELVPGIFSKDLSFLQAMAFRAGLKGYECHAFLTSSALHGGYQDRRRFHFVASRVALDWEGVYKDEPTERKQVRTLGDALREVDLARMNRSLVNDEGTYKGAFGTLFEHTAPGMHLGHVPDEILRKVYRPRSAEWSGTGRPGFAHTRGRLDRPSPNVLGGHTIVHPVEDRYITPRECATIMGFPLDHAFSPGSKAYAEIGRGLCTHNAAFLGRVMKRGLEENRQANVERMGPLRVVDWRNRVRTNSLALGERASKQWYIDRHKVEPPKVYGTRTTTEEETETEDA